MERDGLPRLPVRFATQLAELSETGMGYQVISVTLVDGRVFDRVAVIQTELIVSVDDHDEVPFDPEQIASITLTHGPWA